MRIPTLMLVAAALVNAPPLCAQRDTVSSKAPVTRQRVEQRLAKRIQQELALSADQMDRLKSTIGRFGGRRRELQGQQRMLRDALTRQLEPGVTADADSVARMTDALADLRVEYARTYAAELGELRTYLDPVQRARLLALRERLVTRVREMREQRDAIGTRAPRRRPMLEP